MTFPVATDEQQLLVQQAARALGSAGLVHAYGHCSTKIDAAHLLVCAAMPMGLIRDQPGTVVPIDGPLPAGALGEVRIHQAIYRRRSDVTGVCRIMPPAIMALSSQSLTPTPRHGIGAYFYPRPPLWPNPRLLRNDADAAGLAEMLGDAPAIVMRGNGAVVAADSLEKAVTLSWFLEDAARVERDVRAMGFEPGEELDPDEARDRTVFAGNVVQRMWQHLTGDLPITAIPN